MFCLFYHRQCPHVDKLRHVGKGIKTSVEYKTSKESLDEIISRMKQEKDVRSKNLTSIHQQKEKLMKDVDKFQDEVIDRIKDLAKISKQQIRSKHEEYKKAIETDEAALGTVISSATKTLAKLSAFNDSRVFVNVKACENAVKEGESLLEDMSKEWIRKELRFSFNQGLKDKLVSLGHIVDSVKEYKAELYGQFKINKEQCNVTGVSVMENGTVLVAEHSTSLLKRLNENFTVRDLIPLNGQPDDMCKAGHSEVALCLGNAEKVQFVSIGHVMELSHAFEVGKGSNGISYNDNNGEMYVCYSTRISVFSKAGVVLRSFEKDENDKPMFCSLRKIALSAMKELIFVTDKVNGLIVLNKDGKKVWIFSDPELKEARGVCVLPGDLVFVSGAGSSNIFQVDNDGRKEGMLVGPSNGLNRPLAIAYDEENSRIVVGCGSNEIYVYSISSK